jgi:hypothetical protein
VARIKRRLGADGGSVENQDRAIYSHDMGTAQELVATCFPKAADVYSEKMAQAVAQATQAASGGSTPS